MHRTPAAQRYTQRTWGISVVYIALVTVNTVMTHAFSPPRALAVAVAVASALPVVALIVTLARYLREETDEYIRNRSIHALLLALGVMLSLSSVLGMLQIGQVIGRVPIFLTFVVWACAWGIATLWLERRDRRDAAQP